ncbi:cell wall metabolism sensor histidine kinase WalK [uncultured Anaerococcus sp.]|uniref:sensor histidine kinase n=1 Tax=uncultured Anaerococcus sp. TaxID=293428 RepID=UPI002627B022|nr:HAMP domain-containing sensor histidine kinase [uncultured Anaerococcus sp.]
MITLKSKIIRNFTAGILACVLVFSILVTLFVTFNYKELLLDMKDHRPIEVSYWFRKYNKDPNISKDEMWDSIDNLAEDLEVYIKFEEPDGNISYSFDGRDKNNNSPLKEESFSFFNVDKTRRSGTLHVIYNTNSEPISQLQSSYSRAIVYSLIISLLIGFIISLILSDNISEPIMTMSDATIKIKDGYYDIGDRDTDIKELETLQNNINYLSSNLKDQEEIRKQYAQDISHDLRTPLTNLQLYIEAIKDGVIEADENTMDILLSDVQRLEGLIEGLKKTFDDNVENLAIKKEKFDISKETNRIVNSFMVNAENNNITLNPYIQDDIIINSDKDKFNQILQNLISNAIKAIGSDGIIDVYLQEDNNQIVLRVVDDGVGIEEEKIPRIFERFYRIEDSRNTEENGHGLGLSITKNFVEALGGKIRVDSKINEGTAFTLTFIK